jgi:Protein of unknown function (DUF3611)
VYCACVLSLRWQAASADPAKWASFVGVVLGFISTFFAHGFYTLAKKVAQDQHVSKAWLVSSLLRSNTINLLGIGCAVIGLEVGPA